MRMPNGFGSVVKLSGKRRKPYVARKTIGFDDRGYPKYYIVGYYKTKKEALTELTEYNRLYGDTSKRPLLFKEVFKDWFNLKLSQKLSKSRYDNIKSLYKNHLKTIHNKSFQEISLEDLQFCIDIAQKRCKSATLIQIKSFFSEIYKYAVLNDVVKRDISILVKVPKCTDKSEKTPFSLDEIEFLKNSSDDFAKYVYLMIYTGFRASEFISIKREDISNDFIITGGMKSKAGKNRKVPCNEKIIPIVNDILKSGNSYLIQNNDGSNMNYNQFNYKFKLAMNRYGMNHTPHDTRHTFVTLLSNAEANKVSIERLTGHASKGVTDIVYTHKDIEQLKKAINLI